MNQANFEAAQRSKGTLYAATLACLCGVPLTECLAWVRTANHKAMK